VPVRDAVDYVAQACEAVVEAHAIGIVHRDLKPANLFLTKRPDGTPIIKVLDFGISKFLGREGEVPDVSMTQTASVIGSPLYMSPEQMQTPRDTNELTDVWALGTILYELIAGSAPFDAPTMPALCAKICAGFPAPLASKVGPGEVPKELEIAIMRCLERERGKRHASVADLVRKIAPFGSDEAARCAEQAMRVARQAGLPLAYDDDEQTHVRAPAGLEPAAEPVPSESRPVSFMPKTARLRTAPRMLVALVAVLFVGTLIGATVTALRAPLPAQIVGRAARTVARDAELVGRLSETTAQSSTSSEPASGTEVTAPSASADEVTTTESANAVSSASPSVKSKRPRALPPKSPPQEASKPPKRTDADKVLMER
jgi:eukaryotic-like serine/threonine-protein kinase